METETVTSLSMTQTEREQDDVSKAAAVDFSCLPSEVWLQVMERLCVRDRYRMARACSLFHRLFSHPTFWKDGFVDLTQVTMGEEGAVFLGLRRRSKLTAQQFGACFTRLRFHVPNCQVAIDDASHELLSRLCHAWRLRKIELVVSSYGSRCSVYGRDTGRPSCLQAAVMVLRSAIHLNDLDLRQWPVTSDLLRDGERDLGIDRVLADPRTFPELTALDITWKFNPCSATSVVQTSPQTAVDVVCKFRCLKHLSLRHFLLSEGLLRELARGGSDRSALLTLSVTCEEDDDTGNTYVTPELSEAAWRQVKEACPRLEVGLTVRDDDLGLAEWALTPSVPVTSLDLMTHDAPLSQALLSRVKTWRDTLRALTAGGGYRGYRLALDDVVLDVATSCAKLQHLDVCWKVQDDTLQRLTSLNRHWTLLKFV